jgi:hypothetical protein
MEMVCQPSMLGRASVATVRHSAPSGHMRMPLSLKNTNSQLAPSVMVMARKYSGDSSRSDSFIMGQFTPHMMVSATSASS